MYDQGTNGLLNYGFKAERAIPAHLSGDNFRASYRELFGDIDPAFPPINHAIQSFAGIAESRPPLGKPLLGTQAALPTGHRKVVGQRATDRTIPGRRLAADRFVRTAGRG